MHDPVASPGSSSSHALVNVFTKTFAAILLGFFCVRLNYINPKKGEMKALGFFVGESHYRCWFLTQLSLLILEPCQLAWSRLAKFRKSCCASPRFLQVLIFEVTLDLVSARARSVLSSWLSPTISPLASPVMHALYPPQPHPSEGVSTKMIAYLAINAVLAYVVFFTRHDSALAIGQVSRWWQFRR